MVNLLIWNNQGSVWFSSKWPEKSWQLLDLSFAKRSDHFWSCSPCLFILSCPWLSDTTFFLFFMLLFNHDSHNNSSHYWVLTLCQALCGVLYGYIAHFSVTQISTSGWHPILRMRKLRLIHCCEWGKDWQFIQMVDLKRMNDMWTLSSKDKTHQACFLLIKHMWISPTAWEMENIPLKENE